MAYISYQNIGIMAIAACVPPKIMHNSNLGYLVPEEDIQKIIQTIGISEKRYVDQNVCASDLCCKAAVKLINDNQIDLQTIDGLIFVSQTPDFKVPATAPIIQHRLGLKQECLSFDVNLACSGFVYGLALAYSLVSNPCINRILLLVGDTLSKTVSAKDKLTVPLFGDAGTAAIIEKGDYSDSTFSLNSDGSGAEIMQIPYGGSRNPSCSKGFEEITDSEGNTVSGENIQMMGMEVFNFGIKVVTKDIKDLLNFKELTTEDIDVLIFHQANQFMTNFFAKRLKVPLEKTPYSMFKYGNTSSASIPLTIVTEMDCLDKFANRQKVVISGFGAGLSWGTGLISLKKTSISKLIEY